MIDMQKVLSIIINFIIYIVCIKILGIIILPGNLNENMHIIIAIIITLIAFYILPKMNQNKNSLGWIISKKLIQDKDKRISLWKVALFLLFEFYMALIFILLVKKIQP